MIKFLFGKLFILLLICFFDGYSKNNFNFKNNDKIICDSLSNLCFSVPGGWYFTKHGISPFDNDTTTLCMFEIYNYDYINLPIENNLEEFDSTQFKYYLCGFKSTKNLNEWIIKDSLKDTKYINLEIGKVIEATIVDTTEGQYNGNESKIMYLKIKDMVVEIGAFNLSEKSIRYLKTIANSMVYKD